MRLNGCFLSPNITGRRWGPMGGSPPQGLLDSRVIGLGLTVVGGVMLSA